MQLSISKTIFLSLPTENPHIATHVETHVESNIFRLIGYYNK